MVIVIDTNLVSELTRLRPEPRVVAWFDAQVHGELWTTAVNVAEILEGVGRLPPGHRRSELATQTTRILEVLFDDRVAVFDVAAAATYARVSEERRRAGRPVAALDLQIVAIALAHGADGLATRNTKDFEGSGLRLIDPWRD